MGIHQYPFFVRWGWGCIRICSAYLDIICVALFGAFFWGCGRRFGVLWVICRLVGKFGLKSILRLQNRGVGFVVGLGFPVGGLVGCWQSLGLTASKCGNGCVITLLADC